MRRERIFLIGPGGVGKTTVGRLLAPLLGYGFVDLDEVFCERVRPIRRFLDEHGYGAYVRRNSELLHELLAEYGPASRTAFALSSGFLATDVEASVVERNRATIRASGKSVLLLPSEELEMALAIVLERQLKRGLNLERDSEERTFRERFTAYRGMGDLRVFSAAMPEQIAQQIFTRLAA